VLPKVVTSPSPSVLGERIARTGQTSVNLYVAAFGMLLIAFGIALYVFTSLNLSRTEG
jgi:hypothetical protein